MQRQPRKHFALGSVDYGEIPVQNVNVQGPVSSGPARRETRPKPENSRRQVCNSRQPVASGCRLSQPTMKMLRWAFINARRSARKNPAPSTSTAALRVLLIHHTFRPGLKRGGDILSQRRTERFGLPACNRPPHIHLLPIHLLASPAISAHVPRVLASGRR